MHKKHNTNTGKIKEKRKKERKKRKKEKTKKEKFNQWESRKSGMEKWKIGIERIEGRRCFHKFQCKKSIVSRLEK